MADFENGNDRFEDEPRYERDRSASPRAGRRDDDRGDRNRSRSPNGRSDNRAPPPSDTRMRDAGDDEGAVNTGSNLFVTGIHPRLNEEDVSRLFEKYGDVESCSIMLDPHTKESRGFGFVKMVTSDQADAAKEALQGEVIEGRTLSIEKARRARPRTPTPGKYFGPPKRGDYGGGGRGPPRGGRFDRYDDRRGGGYGGGRRDDGYRSSDRNRDYGRRDDYGSRNIDRYASSRDDRYGGRGDDRRGGGYRDEGRDAGYGDSAASRDTREPREPREPYTGGGRSYEGRDDRYPSR